MTDIYKIEYKDDQGKIYFAASTQDDLEDYSDIGKFVWLCEIFCDRVFGGRQIFYDCVQEIVQEQKYAKKKKTDD
jgi:hypothetical protein